MKPTYLYIKEHTVTGMKYLGKTTKPDPNSYLGSGKYWKRHIKKHGVDHVVTLWTELFTDQSKLMETAFRLSKENDILNSHCWANLQYENGLDGWTSGTPIPHETKIKISLTKTGIKNSQKHCENISKGMVGMKRSPETRMKMSIAKKGIVFTAEHRAKLSAARRRKVKRSTIRN